MKNVHVTMGYPVSAGPSPPLLGFCPLGDEGERACERGKSQSR